ncbi:hypothetical protein L798_12954 [Zootermopsis nevadensis]|uniref:CCHC-type domain-containing protein n=1 Tax=Zootermopsis nevadensis TaxID=136037 RepID=A0A067QTI8_ZOONE|nr:hypothetical protein L798_12954 [Zootermopsis nevadensis]
MLVDGIAITASTYEETKKILHTRYGDRNRIIQAHLDYLELSRPIHSATPEALNYTFLECNRRIQALRALGEDVGGYGRVLTPKILRAFPPDMCQRWIVHVKRQELSEGDVIKLMAFLGEKVDGILTAQKIRGDYRCTSNFTPTAATPHINSKHIKSTRKGKGEIKPFCVFCESRTHWAQDCQTVSDGYDRIERLKAANRCFLCLNRGHGVRRARPHVQDARGTTIEPFVLRRRVLFPR